MHFSGCIPVIKQCMTVYIYLTCKIYREKILIKIYVAKLFSPLDCYFTYLWLTIFSPNRLFKNSNLSIFFSILLRKNLPTPGVFVKIKKSFVFSSDAFKVLLFTFYFNFIRQLVLFEIKQIKCSF